MTLQRIEIIGLREKLQGQSQLIAKLQADVQRLLDQDREQRLQRERSGSPRSNVQDWGAGLLAAMESVTVSPGTAPTFPIEPAKAHFLTRQAGAQSGTYALKPSHQMTDGASVFAFQSFADDEPALILRTIGGLIALPLSSSGGPIRQAITTAPITPRVDGPPLMPGSTTVQLYKDDGNGEYVTDGQPQPALNWFLIDEPAPGVHLQVARGIDGHWWILPAEGAGDVSCSALKSLFSAPDSGKHALIVNGGTCDTIEISDCPPSSGGGGGAITQPPMLDELADVTVSPTEPSGAPAGEFWVEATPQAPSVNPVAVALDDLVDVTVAASEPAGLSDGAFWVDTR